MSQTEPPPGIEPLAAPPPSIEPLAAPPPSIEPRAAPSPGIEPLTAPPPGIKLLGAAAELDYQIHPKVLLQLYFNTFICASFAELFAYPFDVVKTRLHVQGEAAEKTTRKKRGMMSLGWRMVRDEGFMSLYSGLSVMVTRNLVFNSTRVVLYDVVRQQLIYLNDEGKPVLPIQRALVAACIGGCVSQALANPFDVVKVRMQMEGMNRALGKPVRVRNMVQAFRDIYAHGGVRHMWKGVGPSCTRSMLMTAGDTAAYDISKRKLIMLTGMDDGYPIQFLSSVCAGFVASLLSTPSDVIKSRIMNQPSDENGKGLHYKNAIDCLHKLVKQEGFLAMYKGFLPCWMRIGPWAIVFWVTLEQLRQIQGQVGF